MEKKNIILLVADQLRYDVLGVGYTPNIDALCAESVNFKNAYCACPLCGPARGALFTGLYPTTNGSLINPWHPKNSHHGMVKSKYDNFYNLMQRSDYDCVHSGKQHLFVEGTPLQDREDSKFKWVSYEKTYNKHLSDNKAPGPGGEIFRSPCPEMHDGKYTHITLYSNPNTSHYEADKKYYFDSHFNDKALEYLENRTDERPLFLSMMYLAPHPPLSIPSPYYELSREITPNLPENVCQFYKYQSPLQAYNLPGVMGLYRTYEQWVESWKVYLALVKLLDDCIGKIIDKLKEKGEYDNSIILFSSDHGEMLGSHRLFQKMCMYEESAKVPFSLKMSKSEYAGKVIDNTISHIDLMPTLSDLTGLKLEHEVQGESLLPLITGEKTQNRNTAYIQFDGNGALGNFQRCIVDGKYKLIMDIFKDETYYELYNIENDPQEKVNLIFEDGNLDKAYSCLNKLLNHLKEVDDYISPTTTNLEEFIENYR